MFNKVGSVLGTLPRRGKMSGALIAMQVREAFKMSLKETCKDLPLEQLSIIKPKSFEDGVLVVSCKGVVATELAMRASRVLKSTNDILGRRVVKNIRFRSTD